MEREFELIRYYLTSFQCYLHRVGNHIDHLMSRHSGEGKKIVMIRPLRPENIPADIPNTRLGNGNCIEMSRHVNSRLAIQNYFNDNERNYVRGIAQDCVNSIDNAETCLGRIDNLTEVIRTVDPEYTMDLTSLYDIITSLDVLVLVY
jgi:hypothetical protein